MRKNTAIRNDGAGLDAPSAFRLQAQVHGRCARAVSRASDLIHSFIHLSIHLLIHLSNHPSIRPSIHLIPVWWGSAPRSIVEIVPCRYPCREPLLLLLLLLLLLMFSRSP